MVAGPRIGAARSRRHAPALVVVQGELLYEQAKLEPDREKRIQLAERAVADIDRALARNRFLRRDHAQYLGAARPAHGQRERRGHSADLGADSRQIAEVSP